MSPYIIKFDDIMSVLNSLRADTSYPNNMNHTLQDEDVPILIEYLSIYLRVKLANGLLLKSELIEVIKHLPIFTEVDHRTLISLISGNKEWYLLPHEEENSKVICTRDKGFLSTYPENLRYILEEVIKIPRLRLYDYWLNYV